MIYVDYSFFWFHTFVYEKPFYVEILKGVFLVNNQFMNDLSQRFF